LNPIVVLDLGTVVLSLVVFHLTHETQKSFGGLFKSAFTIFYSVCILSLAVAILEITGFIVPDASVSTLALHVLMFGILLLILVGMSRLSGESPFKNLLKK